MNYDNPCLMGVMKEHRSKRQEVELKTLSKTTTKSLGHRAAPRQNIVHHFRPSHIGVLFYYFEGEKNCGGAR